jgi:hypothetical protein
MESTTRRKSLTGYVSGQKALAVLDTRVRATWLHDIIGKVDQQLSEAALGSGIVTEDR